MDVIGCSFDFEEAPFLPKDNLMKFLDPLTQTYDFYLPAFS